MRTSKIEWTQITWNPTTGCTKVSSGCKNCYAEKMAKRLHSMGNHKYRNCFKLTIHENMISEPYSWQKPRMVFVNSMSDLFHEDIPDDFIASIFKSMNDNQKHIFQILTKRSERLAKISKKLKWTPNIWMGVTVEDKFNIKRIFYLENIYAKIKFISCEPLLSQISNLDLRNIHWMIVGGESGFNARPMRKSWVVDIKSQCIKYNVPFFFKQWGGPNKKKSGRILNGETFSEMPESNIELYQERLL